MKATLVTELNHYSALGSVESIKGISKYSYIFIENYPQLLYTF